MNLKSVLPFCMVCVLLLNNFSRYFINIAFTLNQPYLAKNICENRNKPNLHCNGKCFLRKKIIQAQQKEQNNNAENLKNQYKEALIYQKSFLSLLYPIALKIFYPNLHFSLQHFTFPIFHPPTFKI